MNKNMYFSTLKEYSIFTKISNRMSSFLFRVAETFYNQEKSGLSQLTFVFPNRRAGLFFRNYLSQLTDKPLFSPEILTINECFASASSLQPADKLSNLFRIYRIYRTISSTDESFDSFVFWGEMLLNDFDETDKYLVDARQLFQNVTELNEIERLFNTLTENQMEVIRHFWKNFIPVSEEKTKEEFIATWKVLYDVYSEFEQQLQRDGLGTEGMICREVAERLLKKENISQWDSKQFIFVGFNALNPCEKNLMLELQSRGQADFYWDYESDQLRDNDNPASLFYAENTTLFASKYSIAVQSEELSSKKITLTGIPSAIGMTKYIYATLRAISAEKAPSDSWINTAVVLPDENLLLPMMYAFPPTIDKINITMGYPLSSTPVAGLIMQIFELHRRIRRSGQKTLFYHKNVLDILHHQYISQLIPRDVEKIAAEMIRLNRIYMESTVFHLHPLLQLIFQPVHSTSDFLQYLLEILQQLSIDWKNAATETNDYKLERDFLQQFYLTINRVQSVFTENSEDAGMTIDTLSKIIQQLIAGVSIPFVGEPLDGLQVMGVLESRGLDFENLIIASFNEGIFPKKTGQNSFIPYNLRKGFGLPTYEHNDAITSYNFYRLIHRAKNIYFVFDSRTDGSQTGEVSRFINQLNYHYGLNIELQNVNYDISFGDPKSIVVKKTPKIMEKLGLFLTDDISKRHLSASTINNYLNCPLQFYLSSIEQLNQADEVKESIEDSVFGTLFHSIMEYIYEPFKGQLITEEMLNSLLNNPLQIEKYIQKAFAADYFKTQQGEKIELEGNNLLIANVLRKYVNRVLHFDKLYAPFRIISTEHKCSTTIETKFGKVNIKGIIDRIDEKEGKLRLLDYKTGKGSLDFNTQDDFFTPNKYDRPKNIFQTFLYGLLYKNEADGKSIKPGIIYLRDTYKDSFNTDIFDKKRKETVEDWVEYEDEFTEKLSFCLEDIFDSEVPFSQTEILTSCEYCQYKNVCNR